MELNQRHHVIDVLPEVDCGPKAQTVLKELHAPTSVVATLMLERELSALRLSEGEPVQPVLDKMRDLYAKLATAGITYPEQTKCLKMLSLLPESWLQFTSGLSLPQNQSLWTFEWVRTKILEEDFRRRHLRSGDNESSGYGMQGSGRGRGRAEMTAWLKKQGIQRVLYTAYTAQSNGVAEQANRIILETARALLIESGVGNSMWPHFLRHATVARNRVLSKLDLTPSAWEEGEEAAA
ncbi:unnamed protein product [Closterium sp. NIES-53]